MYWCSSNIGSVKFGEIKGENIQVDTSDTLGGVNLDGDGSDIIVGSSLSYTGSNVVANSVDISLSGTDVDIELNSGSKDDEFTIDDDNAGSNEINLTLTGDLGSSETSIDLNSIDSSTTAEELKQGDLVGIKFDNGASHTVDVSAVKNTTVGIDLGAGDDTITTANEGITVVSAGAGYDTINLGDGIDAVVLKDLTSPSDDGKLIQLMV